MDVNGLKERLIASEGYRKKAYRCTAGKLSIGVGRNLDDVGLRDDEIALMLDNDIKEVVGQLDHRLPMWKSLDPVRQSVLADMCFNMGINKLLGFKNTLRLIESGEYAAAATGMLNSLWARQVGKRAIHLADLMRPGIDSKKQ